MELKDDYAVYFKTDILIKHNLIVLSFHWSNLSKTSLAETNTWSFIIITLVWNFLLAGENTWRFKSSIFGFDLVNVTNYSWLCVGNFLFGWNRHVSYDVDEWPYMYMWNFLLAWADNSYEVMHWTCMITSEFLLVAADTWFMMSSAGHICIV